MSEIRIEKGCAGELPDILDFANYVFSQSSQPHDFRRLLPKLYGENSGSEGYHYLVREDGRIRAMVCAMPLSLLVAASRCGGWHRHRVGASLRPGQGLHESPHESGHGGLENAGLRDGFPGRHAPAV